MMKVLPVSVLAVMFLLSCAGVREKPADSAERVEIIPAGEVSQERWRELNAFSAVSALYRGLFCRLDLAESLSLRDKWRVVEAVYCRTPLIGERSSRELLVECRIGDFYESGLGLRILSGWFGGKEERVEWISDCVRSPLTGGPLLGRGAFIGDQGEVYNYDDALYIRNGRAVRAADAANGAEAAEAAVQGRETTEAACVILGQTLLYGGIPWPEDDGLEADIRGLAGLWPGRRDDVVFAALLVLAEKEMDAGRYGEAEALLDALFEGCAAEEDPRSVVVLRERELLRLTEQFAAAARRP